MQSQLLKFTICLVFSSLLSFYNYAQNKVDKIDQLMHAYHRIGQFNGVVLIADSGTILYQKAFGYSNFKDSISHTLEGRFRISSMTKQFTAMLTLQLAQEGKLTLTDKITDHLSYYRKETGGKVSIHHLLCHQSGIPSISRYKNFRKDSIGIPLPLEFLIKNWCMGDLAFEPGTSTNYSNSNYMILGAIIERITQKPYYEVLKEKILIPSGMKNTALVPDSGTIVSMPIGYLLSKEGFVEEKPIAYSNLHAAGQMYSTAYDLYLWDRALTTNKLLSKQWQDKIFSSYLGDHGYGWKVYRRLYEGQEDSCTTSYHGRGFEGISSFIQRFHEREMVMIFMSNTNVERRKTGTIRDDIINILFDLPYEVPIQKKTITISEDEFEVFEGNYASNEGQRRSIIREDKKCIYISKRGRKYTILPESVNTFFFEIDNRSTLTFNESEGKMYMLLHTLKSDIIFTKE